MSVEIDERNVAAVREFNRFYTATMGLLDQGHLQSRFSLTEARVLFELAQDDATEVVDLRARARIDAGHLSRILARFDGAGVVERSRSSTDGRRQIVRLTTAGRDAFGTLDARSNRHATELLAGLGDADRRRLVDALTTVRSVLGDPPTTSTQVLRSLRPGDLGWVVHRNGALYAEEHGWDQTYEALVARIAADYGEHHDPARENAWIAELDGRPAGSVFCVREDDDTARLRLLLVEPSARGRGLGGLLVDECMRFARAAGYRSMVLWTVSVLAPARRIYQRAGFQLVSEDPRRRFGHDLVGQDWRAEL
ncbi:MAG TPA: bifunctional helix-turn-helix transcriptional regulator/GNAT family N-acetyltransferase [Jiangellaceae bacterium]